MVTRARRTLSGRERAWRYGWDAEDHLVSAVTPDGARWAYRYDGLGRRVAKERLDAGGAVVDRVDFVWDGLVLVEQITGGTALTWDYEPGSHRPLTQVERVLAAPQEWVDARFHAVVSDVVGMPTELVDDGGALVWRSQRTLWGAALAEFAGGPDCPLRFAGQYHDRETGLFYNVHRYYDPETARYSSPDPLGPLAGPNPHACVVNPLRLTDPLGLSGCDRALEILTNPDGVYHSTGTGGRLIFRQGDDVLITEGPGSKAGQLVTSYGPSGPRGGQQRGRLRRRAVGPWAARHA
ncbi:RHS repeat-associated core domain-containing protein [Actinosynnema sp.]|uniref:RHS repeat-associated core domain-containing protein n=1 Tax=Actinosynnema sp. TaxID=1872144 RepID=UPI003F86AFA4